MTNLLAKKLITLVSFVLLFNFSAKSQCTIDAGSDLFICVDKFGVVDTTIINATFNGDSTLKYRWRCEHLYAGFIKLTASTFMKDTTKLQAKIINSDAVENNEKIHFWVEAYDSNDINSNP